MVASSSPTDVVVVAGEDETRVLLRGLLRLHRLKVLGEAEGATPAFELLARHRPGLLVVDGQLAEGTAADLIDRAKRARPDLRIILVAHAGRPFDGLGQLRPDVILQRPFRIRELAEALEGTTVAPN